MKLDNDSKVLIALCVSIMFLLIVFGLILFV